jgi:hypothetical protein
MKTFHQPVLHMKQSYERLRMEARVWKVQHGSKGVKGPAWKQGYGKLGMETRVWKAQHKNKSIRGLAWK